MEQLHTDKICLLTGGAGFIGSSAVGELVHSGWNVIVLDALTYAGFEENLQWIDNAGFEGNYTLVRGSITDSALVGSLFVQYQPRAVLNFAAESHVDNSIAAPSDFIHTNIIGTYTMLEAARTYHASLNAQAKAAFRFVQISTDEVYGSLGETGKFHEDYPMQPNSPYTGNVSPCSARVIISGISFSGYCRAP